MHTMPTLFGERARAIRHASCGSQLWPARLLGMCAGFLCSGCGRPMRSDNVTSFVAALATSQRRCSASCCRPRLCTVSGVPQTTPFARDLSLLPPRRTHRPASRFLSVPIDTTLTFHTHLPHSPSTALPSVPVLIVSITTVSVPKEELISRRASRATQQCDRSSRPSRARAGS